jgi:hypothetical protein
MLSVAIDNNNPICRYKYASIGKEDEMELAIPPADAAYYVPLANSPEDQQVSSQNRLQKASSCCGRSWKRCQPTDATSSRCWKGWAVVAAASIVAAYTMLSVTTTFKVPCQFSGHLCSNMSNPYEEFYGAPCEQNPNCIVLEGIITGCAILGLCSFLFCITCAAGACNRSEFSESDRRSPLLDSKGQ